MRCTPPQCGQHVVQGGRLRTGDDTDTARKAWYWPFARRIEQAFLFQFLFQPYKGFVEVADAGATDRFDVELIVAARGVQRHQRAHFDLVAFTRRKASMLGAAFEHYRAHLGGIVLEREIPVTGSSTGKIGYFTGHPNQRKGTLEHARDCLVQGGNRKYWWACRGCCGGAGEIVDAHGWQIILREAVQAL